MSTIITAPARAASLASVATILVSRNKTGVANDASATKGTLQTINAAALSFGPLAPGAVSETKIIYLNAPYAKTIDNIKIALVNTGELFFSNLTFGIAIRSYLDYNLVPMTYFQGVNLDDTAANPYNFVVSSADNVTSQYVYLNVFMRQNQPINAGVVRYKWFFDYA